MRYVFNARYSVFEDFATFSCDRSGELSKMSTFLQIFNPIILDVEPPEFETEIQFVQMNS